ncbi:MAG: ABC transporter permease [Pseudomonadota bacterium]
MRLLNYASRRLLRGFATFLFAVTITFFLVRLLPGDPMLAIAAPGMTEELLARQIADLGLDRSLIVQYVAYLRELGQGNLGISFLRGQPVSEVLMARLPWTLLLTGSALLVTIVLGVPLGVLAAVKARGAVDRLVQVVGVIGQSLFVPSIGIFLLYTLGLWLGLFPIGSAVDPDTHGAARVLSILHHLALPCLTLVMAQLASYVLTLRATLIESLGEEYCDLARVKGASESRVVWQHALRNALLPTTTLVGLQIGFLVGGAVLTETIYAYPGVGRAIFEAVGQLDYPVLQGAFVLLAATVVLANLLTDLLYGLLDPRVRTA